MSYEKYYPGGWQSGESGGTPITPEALNHIENGIKQTYSDFAPAGYGLGMEGLNPDSPDTFKGNGFIGFNPSTFADGEGRWGLNLGNDWVFQYATDKDGGTLQRVKSTGDFSEWGWVNPPMKPGEEYRTTERHNGKPVYTMLVVCGYLPNNTNNFLSAPYKAKQIIRAVGTGTGGSRMALPAKWQEFNAESNTIEIKEIDMIASIYGIAFCTNFDASGISCDIQVWYIKD